MFRKLLLAAFIATGTVGGLTVTTPTASAQPTVGPDRDERRDRDDRREGGLYRVMVRHHDQWNVYRTYRDRDDAYRAARQLERRGLDTKVERVRRR